jgi:hypothetical protein
VPAYILRVKTHLYFLQPAWFGVTLLVGVLCFVEVGRRLGKRQIVRDPAGWQAGTGAIEAAIFALLGLMLGFTFSGAMNRLDARRQQIVSEANAIGTAYFRLDLLPAETQPELRDLFREYVDARLSAYAKIPDLDAVFADLDAATHLQREIWTAAIAAGTHDESAASMRLLLPAINEMIDITTARTMAAQIHNPPLFYYLIACLVLVGGTLAGYGMASSRQRNWLHILGFATITATVLYIVVDVDYPRQGIFRIDRVDQCLKDVRAAMN